MDVVLGVALASNTPTSIHTVLVCGERGDGVTLEELSIDVPTDDSAEFAAVDALIAAILRVRDAAEEAGHHLVSTGVTVTDPLDAAALSSRLSSGALDGVNNVALISPVLAAASLAHNLGQIVGCDQMGLLSIESAAATLATIDCTDGTVTRIFRQVLHDGDATAAVDTVADRLNAASTCPDGLFLICSAGDSTALRPRLEATVDQEVCEPAEPRSALARGAALASARLVAAGAESAALAYTQEPASGAFGPSYYDIPGFDADELAYSAVPDDEAEAATEIFAPVGQPARRPLLVAGAALASATFAAASALMVAMTLDITPNLVALRPDLGRALTIPHLVPNLQVPAAEPFGGEPPVMGQPPADSLPLPPLTLPSAPNVPAAVPMGAPAPGLPAPVPLTAGAGTRPVFVPAPVFGPPLPMRPPAAAAPSPLVVAPVPQPPHSRPILSGLPDLSFLWGVPGKQPEVKPDPPVVKPDPPVVGPKPPVVLPNPPVVKPDPPIVKPSPPVVLPTLPVVKPDPPVVKPEIPVIKPNPPVVKPDLPVVNPSPPVVKLPDPPVQVPDLPAANPSPGIGLPNLPVQLPNSGPPAGLPVPQAPVLPSLPAPQAPSLPAFTAPQAPSLPAFTAPQAPSLPAFTAPQAPAFPSLPAPQAPSLPSLPAPSAPSMPNLGGGLFGGGGKPGGGLFGGGGNPGGGLFGGGHGGGLFGGGGHGGGLFGGGGGGLFGGGGRGLFGH